MEDKIRLDSAMVERGICSGRDRAKSLIQSGNVSVNGKICSKPSFAVNKEDEINLINGDIPFVSRGGLKLEKAISEFSIDLNNKICADIGASTGGFTDCMLQNGAVRVYAVDTGIDQLAEKLKNDPRVINLENLNFRLATKEHLPEPLDFVSVDVSFISLKFIIPVLPQFLKDDALAVLLIKPQFEAGKNHLGNSGVVREKGVHMRVIEDIVEFCQQNGFYVIDLTFSPVKGPKGNIEYLLYIKKSIKIQEYSKIKVDETVNLAHNILNIKK